MSDYPPPMSGIPDAGDAQFRVIFDHAATGIGLVDLAGRIGETNAAFQRMIGYSAEELRGMPLAQITNPEDLPADRELLRDLLRGKRHQYEVENRYLRKGGECVWGHVTVSVLRDRSGQVTHALAMVHDVTEQRRAEMALAESEGRFRSLIENASEIVTILGEDGVIQYESPAVERVLGFTPSELVGRTFFEFTHDDDREEIGTTFQQVLQNPGKPIQYGLRFRHRDGSYRWLEGIATNLLSDHGVSGVVANSRDVTERIESERKLAVFAELAEREKALFEQLFMTGPAAVVLIDADDRVLRINPEFVRLFGYSESEAVGRTLTELIAPENLQAEALSLTWQTAEGERTQLDTVRRRKDGSIFHVAMMGVPVQLRGNQIAVYGMYHDITLQKELEAALEQQASTDPLTGLLNRRGFLAQLGREWENARTNGSAPLIVYVDLDGFKGINDTFGHSEGDRVLQEVAEILKRCFRASDAVARLGGDEFAVVAADAEENSELVMCNRVRSVLKRANEEGNRPYSIAMSIGAIRASASVSSAEEMLTEADRRMYEQKRKIAPESGEAGSSQ